MTTAPRHAPTRESSELPPRLQKVLAQAGFGSRRACEQLISEGRVEVDRDVASELGVRVDPARQEVRVDGELVRPLKLAYFAVNKPEGVVTTNRDPHRRPRVIDLVKGGENMFAVGRLDMSSSGLMIVTNDGDFANRVAHPRYGVEKTYRVVVAGIPLKSTLDSLRRGMYLAEGPVRVVSLKVKSQSKKQTTLEVVLNEGRNRELRRMFARIGNKVLSLHRVAIGPLRLGDLPPGAHRPLSKEEIRRLLDLAKGRASHRLRPLKASSGSRRKHLQTTKRGTPGFAASPRGRMAKRKSTRRRSS